MKFSNINSNVNPSVIDRMSSVSFCKYRDLLLPYLPEECVSKIEKYYISMYYFETLSRFRMMEPSFYEEKSSMDDYYSWKYALVLPSKDFNYYKKSAVYFQNFTRETKDKQVLKERIRELCRYLIYNMDYFRNGRCSPNMINRYKDALKQLLIRNAPHWDMCGYYYKQIFLKELIFKAKCNHK